MENLTWTCHICKRERPDTKISVISKPIMLRGRKIGEQNIRYCNDNLACRTGAPEFDMLKRRRLRNK